MSRLIPGKSDRNEDKQLRSTGRGKLIVTKRNGKELGLLLRENRLLQVIFPQEQLSKVGSVYLGKVKQVKPNLDACFVEIADKEMVYLPFCQCKNPYLTNRAYDGRILEGDELVVQIERDALKTKQAAATTKITLTGRYAVFSIGSSHTGISGKLSKEERAELLHFLAAQGFVDEKANWKASLSSSHTPRFAEAPSHSAEMPLSCAKKQPPHSTETPSCAQYSTEVPSSCVQLPSYSAVIRTEAAKADTEALLNELQVLESTFRNIFAKALHSTCFTCLADGKSPWVAALEQIPSWEYEEVVTDLPDFSREMTGYFKERSIPLRWYQDETYPLSRLYSIDTRLHDALSRRIWLKSGAYLVVDVTEALTVFDVNSGKYDVKKASEEAFYRINREAAEEIALQIRLRNLSGIILVDFINMMDKSMQNELLDYMKILTGQDRVHTTVVDITPLGLMEITRKKINKPLADFFKENASAPNTVIER